MRRSSFSLVLFIILPFMTLAADDKPPKIYVDEGACPFECCTYREWIVTQAVQLIDKPNGKKVIGSLRKGEKVDAITGEVHVVPTPVKVTFAKSKFKVGDTVYLLTYLGEGMNKVWHKGEISDEETMFLDQGRNNAYEDGKSANEMCKIPSENCWGKVLGKEESDWWIQIEMKNGKKGWTKESSAFENKDACG